MQATDKEGRALLCQCLAAVAMADGDLDSREIAAQLTVIEQISGVLPSADEVVAASIEVDDWDEFVQTLEQTRTDLTADFCQQILNACIMIGRADDSIESAEMQRIGKIASALGFTQQDVQQQLKIIR
ncbi:MAG: TerB family tellurite resistance protein [Pseudomonadales bacterium]|jgi:tellurite resistance protein